LRAKFEEAAELYDRARPGYPAHAIDDLVALARIGPASRVLEIGVGTGQLTLPLAQRGCRIVGIELGAELAAIARRKLAAFPSVEIHVGTFEAWPLPLERFDAVVSATAFHWIDPEIRITKTADALRRGGALAVVGTHHVAGGSTEFFVEVQACYEQWDQTTRPGLRLPAADDIAPETTELDSSGHFGDVLVRRYEWDAEYSAAEYIDLLLTYSGHRALDPDNRTGLLRCIREMIDTRHGGTVTKRYLTELVIAYRQA
jgi:SAM-dependent methyltransferase